LIVTGIRETQQPMGHLFVLVGPPGVGKNAIMKPVMARMSHLLQLPTATTRAIRPTEQEGREHFFLTREDFEALIRDNALIEHKVVHGNLYGMRRDTVDDAVWAIDNDRIADVDILGALDVKSLYAANVTLIFIMPPSVETLRDRMRERGETTESIEKRLERVDMELSMADRCDYLVINDVFDDAVEMVCGIVLAERSRRAMLQLRMRQLELA